MWFYDIKLLECELLVSLKWRWLAFSCLYCFCCMSGYRLFTSGVPRWGDSEYAVGVYWVCRFKGVWRLPWYGFLEWGLLDLGRMSNFLLDIFKDFSRSSSSFSVSFSKFLGIPLKWVAWTLLSFWIILSMIAYQDCSDDLSSWKYSLLSSYSVPFWL